jgi:hypothetical protein
MSQLCQFKEHIDVTAREHTPQGIQDLLDELEASKQARLRAWAVEQYFLQDVDLRLEHLKKFPLIGRLYRGRYRRLLIPRYPFGTF